MPAKPDAPDRDKYLLSSVNNSLGLLDVLCHHETISLAELARETGFDKASLFRMLYTLERRGLVAKDDSSRYSLGLRLLYYGNIVASRQDIVSTAEPLMRQCSTELGVAVHLGRRSRNRVVTLAIEEAERDIRVSSRVGMNAPLFSTAMGRAILANLPQEELNLLFHSFEYRRYSDHSITSEAQLRKMLQTVRHTGIAEDINDRYPGFGGLGTALFDYTGRCVGAISVVTIASEIERDRERFSEGLLNYAARISKVLGYAPATDA